MRGASEDRTSRIQNTVREARSEATKQMGAFCGFVY